MKKAFVSFVCGLGMLLMSFSAVLADQSSHESTEDLLFINLEPVMTATLTKIDSSKIPASITVITKEDIALTPARNIEDLIDVYVPGSFTMNHHEDTHFAMRGIISDRNYKFLLLVNGVDLNQNAHGGALTELENWDLNDIEKIEIIRGPGSVTYGPGAIECVINIITKNGKTDQGRNLGAQYVSGYNSAGAHYSEGVVKDDYSLYLYGSYTNTPGDQVPNFIANTQKVGPVTLPAAVGYITNPLDFMADYDNDPQLKFYAELDFLKEWKFWARYTNDGQTDFFGNPQTLVNGGLQDLNANQTKQYAFALENSHNINGKLNLSSSIDYNSQTHIRRDAPGSGVYTGPEDGFVNISQNFAQDEMVVKELANYTLSDIYQFALGVNYTFDHYGPGWGQNASSFRMGESDSVTGSSIYILNGPNSLYNPAAVAAQATSKIAPVYVGDEGWSTNAWSFLGEFNCNFNPKLNVILSGRTDKNDYSALLFSPRVAVVSDWGDAGIYKLILQKSLRMNTGEQLYLQHLAGQQSAPEELDGIELIYDSKPIKKNYTFDASLYYNTIKELGWNSPTTSTELLGTEATGGAELEGKYKSDDGKLTAGLNYSYVKQLNFTAESGITKNEISYAAYDYTVNNITLQGTGNELNNMYDQAAKIFSSYQCSKKWTLFGDARILWGMQGAKDGLKMLESAVQGTQYQTVVDNAINKALADGAYDTDARLDVSVRYQVSEPVSITFFVQNLLSLDSAKMFSYDAGLSVLAPSRVVWVEEPTVFGIRANYKF